MEACQWPLRIIFHKNSGAKGCYCMSQLGRGLPKGYTVTKM